MARVILLLCVTSLVVAAVASADTSSLDAIDIDQVFKNDRLLKNYVDCMLDKKPCSKEGSELKARVPQVLDNGCADCSENEKNRSIKVMKRLSKEKPEYWAQLTAKFDPTGEKTKAFKEKYNVSDQ